MWYSHAKKIFVALLLSSALQAQISSYILPIGPTNVHDWRAVRVNPSISGLQTGAFEIGYKVLHAGFADAGTSVFKSGYFILNVPRRLPGDATFGLYSEMFRTPIFQENDLRVFFSRHVMHSMTLGLSLGMRNIGYDVGEFDLVDLNDPVFAENTSLWKFDLGLGLTYFPTSSVIIGLGIEHLNRPNMSLVDDDVHLNPAVTLGVKFNLGQTNVHSYGSVSNAVSSVSSVVEITSEDYGMAQLGLDSDMIWARGRLNINSPFGIAYGMHFPINDLAGYGYGTHEVAFIYEFGRQQRTIELGDAPTEWREFLPSLGTIQVEPQIIAWAEGDESVDIVRKRIIRDIDSDLDSTALSKLTLYDLGLIDSINVGTPQTTFNPHRFQYSLRDTMMTKRKSYVTGENYFSFLRNMAGDLQRDPHKRTFIVTPNSEPHRVYLMGKFLQEELNVSRDQFTIQTGKGDVVLVDSTYLLERWISGDIARDDTITFAIPDSLVLNVFPIDTSMNNHPWEFIVQNAYGDTVFSIAGNCSDFMKITWNWRDQRTGTIIEPGFYEYYISWFDKRGRLRHSAERLIYARQLKSEIKINVAKDYTPPDSSGVKFQGLFLNK